jgi:ubiquinone/menaquinone biosynthesis C-methylase UbiE
VLDDALREISRVLKPDGVAAFLDFAKPSAPWRAKLQLTILKYWCGLVSILVHGRPEHAYIAESMRQFPHRAALRQRMLHHGLRPIHTETFMLGALEILLVQKFKV